MSNEEKKLGVTGVGWMWRKIIGNKVRKEIRNLILLLLIITNESLEHSAKPGKGHVNLPGFYKWQYCGLRFLAKILGCLNKYKNKSVEYLVWLDVLWNPVTELAMCLRVCLTLCLGYGLSLLKTHFLYSESGSWAQIISKVPSSFDLLEVAAFKWFAKSCRTINIWDTYIVGLLYNFGPVVSAEQTEKWVLAESQVLEDVFPNIKCFLN